MVWRDHRRRATKAERVPRLQRPRAARHPGEGASADTPILKKPDWIRVKAPTSEGYKKTREILRENRLVTVCEEAGCPNVGECWSQGHATMMIMGEDLHARLHFCNVATGRPDALDVFEPRRVAVAVEKLGLNHVVITSVDRDDLADGGAEHIAQTIRAVRRKNPGTTIEVLVPDFLRCPASALEAVVAAKPDVFNHNLETVPGLYPGGPARRALLPLARLLQRVEGARPGDVHQVRDHGRPRRGPPGGAQVMDDMRAADVDFLTVGQYLQPTPKHHAVARFVTPEEFAGYEGGLRQGVPDGLGDAADPVELSRRGGFRAPPRRPPGEPAGREAQVRA